MPQFGIIQSTNAHSVVIQNVNVIHPERTGEAVLQPNATVVIGNGRINSVDSGGLVTVPTDAVAIDGTNKWLLPGFIDAHVHFFQSGNPYTRPDGLDMTKLIPYSQENGRNHARLPVTLRTWLACGVTTVMDMGGPFWNFDIREEAQKRDDAPRALVTGPLFSMVADPALELNDPPILRVSDVKDVRILAERQLLRKPNYLKVWFIRSPGDDLQRQEDLVREVGDCAHAAGVPLAVHATELETATSALRAGADILVHSVIDKPVDKVFLDLAKQNHVVYEPTLYVSQGYYEVFSRNWAPTEAESRFADPEVLEHMQDLEGLSEDDVPENIRHIFTARKPTLPPELLKQRQIAERNLVEVWESGVTVALGTDAGNIGTLHGPGIFREMVLMVQAGLTPLQVLRCATTNGAIAAGLEKEVGRVTEGWIADLVILNSNPLENIESASDISYVVKNGRVFSTEELLSNR